MSNFRFAVLTMTLVAAASLGPAAAGRALRQPAGSAAAELRRLADEYVREFVAANPVAAMFLGIPDAPNDHLGDNSLAATRAWEAREDAWRQRLEQINVKDVSFADQATYGVLREVLEGAIQTRVCHSELWPLGQQSGLQIYLPVVAQLQPVGTPELRTAAVARWRAMAPHIDREIQTLREGLRRGYTLPRDNVRAIVEQLDDLLKLPAASSPLLTVATRDAAPGFAEAIGGIITSDINPALKRYRDFLDGEYLPRARTTTAISALPDGQDCYRASVRQSATVDMDAKAVHQLGLDQMAAIENEMRTLGRRIMGTDDLATIVDRLRTDPKYRFQNREEIIRVTERAVERARAAMPRFLTRLPKAEFIVEPCQPFEEKAGCPGSYVPGTPDGKRPGRFRLNAGDPAAQLRTPIEGTAFHEGIPGHHLQLSIAQERDGAHPLTRYWTFSGFSEGWALYAERVADEMGLYSSDLDRLGDLNEQALRAARLVVDSGLHALGWSRQRALDYMTSHLAYQKEYLVSEVDRYIANPGQATAYMIGRLEIERLRRVASDKLGARFDLREFHDRILEHGSVPLNFLRQHIERWVQGIPNP